MVCKLNGIGITERDCRYTGADCKGTCPFCDALLARINTLLEEKRLRGETVIYEDLSDTYESIKE